MAEIRVPDGATFFDAAQQLGRANGTWALSAYKMAAQTQARWALAYGTVSDLILGREFDSWPQVISRSAWMGAADLSELRRLCGRATTAGGSYWGAGESAIFETPPRVSRCQGCGRFFYLTDVRRTTCNGCRAKAEREKKRRQRGTDLSARACQHCGATFTPKRSTARFCSTRCRVAAHRSTG